ncbi:hypothetical protein [Mycobacteroides abscessus]|uniref:hypothetical protein n=1 Tax=Mycobacteroides abscessus TaxID=36809 RepID=UPI00387DD5B9
MEDRVVTQRSTCTTAAAAVCLILAACTHETPTAPPAWDDNDHTSIRWISNPAADLMSPEGTFIRAATESWHRAWIGQGHGMDAIKSAGYPGFDYAFNAPGNRWDPEEVGGHSRRTQLMVGTRYSEVVELKREGPNFKAAICDYTSQVAGQQQGGQYESAGSASLGSGVRLTFGPDPKLPAEQQRSPLAHQRGPAEHPADNVFGTWVMFDYVPLPATTLPQCNKLAPGTPNDWPNPYVRSDPPPTLPPDPGWPEGSKA